MCRALRRWTVAVWEIILFSWQQTSLWRYDIAKCHSLYWYVGYLKRATFDQCIVYKLHSHYTYNRLTALVGMVKQMGSHTNFTVVSLPLQMLYSSLSSSYTFNKWLKLLADWEITLVCKTDVSSTVLILMIFQPISVHPCVITICRVAQKEALPN